MVFTRVDHGVHQGWPWCTWSLTMAIVEDFNCENLAMLPLGAAIMGGITTISVSALYCGRARDCRITAFPTLSYAVEYGGPSTRLMWQYGLATTAFFLVRASCYHLHTPFKYNSYYLHLSSHRLALQLFWGFDFASSCLFHIFQELCR